MTERIPKSVLIAGAVLAQLYLVYLAYSSPGYFTSVMYVGGVLLLEFLVLAIWKFRQIFFPLVMISFLFAGANLPVGSFWTVLRWVFLGVGALVGSIVLIKERRLHFRLFHLFALFAALAGFVSAAVSRYPGFALLKALSLLLLFLYAATGVRVAVAGRENRFFSGLLMGTEIFVAGVAGSHFIGLEAMGNPNSLGAVMGVVAAPILLWGTLFGESTRARQRRLLLYALCIYLVFHSQARAGIAAALISSGLLCLGLRQYKLLAQGVTILLAIIAAVAIFQPETVPNFLSAVTSSVVYKSRDPGLGLLASRQAPWQAAMDTIREHFWFGTGFGTTDNGRDASEHLSQFASAVGVTAENGSSYLAITTWVGMLGIVPFVLLLLSLVGRILRTLAWMLRTGSPSHPAVPLAIVAIAGLLHAGFEDWLFAPGYYLCVFFWSLAFVLVDLAPTAPLPHLDLAWRPARMQQGLHPVIHGR